MTSASYIQPSDKNDLLAWATWDKKELRASPREAQRFLEMVRNNPIQTLLAES